MALAHTRGVDFRMGGLPSTSTSLSRAPRIEVRPATRTASFARRTCSRVFAERLPGAGAPGHGRAGRAHARLRLHQPVGLGNQGCGSRVSVRTLLGLAEGRSRSRRGGRYRVRATARNSVPPVSPAKEREREREREKRGGKTVLEFGGSLDGDPQPAAIANWALLVLSLQYLHANVCNFVIPALLPQVMSELALGDDQGAVLSLSFTAIYAIALLPVGWVADRFSRPLILASSCATWSLATLGTAMAPSFLPLAASRALFAVGMASQNPIAFSLIPELFTNNKAFAISVYNLSIHAGRAGAFLAGGLAGMPVKGSFSGDPTDIWSFPNLFEVPMDAMEYAGVSGLSVLYISGSNLVVAPSIPDAEPGDFLFEIYGYMYGVLGGLPWREIVLLLAVPALVLVPLMALTVKEPRDMKKRSKRVLTKKRPEEGAGPTPLLQAVKEVWASPGFRTVTAAALLNDFGGWTLIAWQSAFYERVHHLPPETYSKMLAVILPLGGVIGGTAGGWLSDKLNANGVLGGRRNLLTASAVLSAPLLAGSLLVPNVNLSLLLLFPGFALTEVFRAPTSVMVQEVATPTTKTSAVAGHLCVRNLVGGLGPLAASYLVPEFGLAHALLIAPVSYLLSAAMFWQADTLVAKEVAAREQREGAAPLL